MNVEKRQEIERKVVRHLIRAMKQHGWNAIYVDDGGDESVTTKTEEEVMEAVFAVDQATIAFHKQFPGYGKTHFTVIVLGNDGYDAIANYSYGADRIDDFGRVMEKEVTPYCEKLEQEVC